MTTTSKLDTAVLDSLDALARDFDHEATHHDELDSAHAIHRASASLRLIRTGLREGTFDNIEGYSWLRAGRAVLRATVYARENDLSFEQAVEHLNSIVSDEIRGLTA